MERNQTIGIVILSVMMLGYLWITQDAREAQDVAEQKAKQEQVVKQQEEAKQEKIETEKKDSIALVEAPNITPKELTVESEDLIITFSNKGGSIKRLELKKHKSYNGKALDLINEKDNEISLILDSKSEGAINLGEKYFETSATSSVLKAGDSTVVSFKKVYGANQYIEQIYTVKGQGYQVGYDLKLIGLDNVFKKTPIQFIWDHKLKRFEQGLKESRQHTSINYYLASDETNDIGAGNDQNETINEALKWVSLKQRFFNTAIIANTTDFTKAELKLKGDENDTLVVKEAYATLTIPVQSMDATHYNYTYYFGPNDYAILKNVTAEFDYNIDLGWGPLSWINKWLVIPIFNFLRGYLSNYGVIIFLLVIVIKMLLFPIAYRSYLSMAKMKELKPELDALREKIGDDQQKMQMESMKLYQETGINPLSGCIPQLLQMPILFALFRFFPNSIELRQQSFLWANDLSTYDAPIMLPFEIPFYGAHISIFTLLMTLSTLAYTYYNNQINSQAAQGPMKNIGYIMPVIFMFVLNSFSAGLTFYYFVSNLITISQQLLASKFIDKDKIREKIEENKKNAAAGGGKKSKFQSMLQEQLKAAEQQRKEAKK
ncbi:MAG: membrane protein insertase YidC [Cytophagales bacterium]|nr:membrane protein insertase YidC [Cytophagales bacterium]